MMQGMPVQQMVVVEPQQDWWLMTKDGWMDANISNGIKFTPWGIKRKRDDEEVMIMIPRDLEAFLSRASFDCPALLVPSSR